MEKNGNGNINGKDYNGYTSTEVDRMLIELNQALANNEYPFTFKDFTLKDDGYYYFNN